MLKNISNLGKVLSKEGQKEIFGGKLIIGGPTCWNTCWNDEQCGDPNKSCKLVPCYSGGVSSQVRECGCTD